MSRKTAEPGVKGGASPCVPLLLSSAPQGAGAPPLLSSASHDARHALLASGPEIAVDELPARRTVALCFRMLAGLVDEPPEVAGVNAIVARTISKGTQRYDARALADAFDALGAQWGVMSGRQAILARVLCLPEFVPAVIDLVGQMFCRPTFPPEACSVAVELAQQDLRRLEDDPQDLLRVHIQRLTLGPVLGRHPGGSPQTLPLITHQTARGHWERAFHAGRLQVAVAGPVEFDAVAEQVARVWADLGAAAPSGRDPVTLDRAPRREHFDKGLKQQYLALTLPGLPKDHPDFHVEQVLIGVLSGGMGGRLFTEVREKLGLAYWVGAWHEQPRGAGVIHVGASTTPARCQQTFDTLLQELERLRQDLTKAEVVRARDGLVAHLQTEDDLTRARAGSLSDDLFHFGRPVGLAGRLQGLQTVTLDRVVDYAARLPLDQLCVATLGPATLR